MANFLVLFVFIGVSSGVFGQQELHNPVVDRALLEQMIKNEIASAELALKKKTPPPREF